MYRENNFDCLRLVAALAVLASHISPIHGSGARFGALGAFGVFVFFSISGYLVSASWERDPSLGRFLTRRVLRVLPALVAAIAFAAFIIGPAASRLSLREYFSHPQFFTYVRSVLLFPVTFSLPAVFESNPLPNVVNGSLATLPIEVAMYAAISLIGVLAVLLPKARLPVLCVCLALCWAVEIRGVSGTFLTMLSSEFVRCAACFFFGCILWHSRRHIGPLHGYWIPFTFLLYCLIHGFYGLWALLLLVPVITVSFANDSYPYINRLGKFGDISYGLYIYAFLIQQSLMHWFPQLGQVEFSVLSVVLSAAAGYASWHLLEHPVLRLKDRLGKKPSTTSSGDAVAQ